MDREEAYRLLAREINRLASAPFSELVGRVGSEQRLSLVGDSGERYEIEVTFSPGSPKRVEVVVEGVLYGSNTYRNERLCEKVVVRPEGSRDGG